MPNVTITDFPVRGTVLDNTLFATETAGLTEKVTASSLKNYVSSLSTITASGVVNASGGLVASTVSAGTIGNIGAVIIGTLSTAAQPNITSLGTLVGLSVNGNILLNGFQVWGSNSLASFGGINNTPIGAVSPSSGAFTSVTSTGLVVNGPASASTGQFTTITATNMNASGSFSPTANLIPTLGSTTRWFGQAYVNIASINTGRINTVNAVTMTSTNQTTSGTLTVGTLLRPDANVSASIGSNTLRFTDVYGATGDFYTMNATAVQGTTVSATTTTSTTVNTTNLNVANVDVSSTFEPTGNLTVNLGSSTKWFNNIYGKSVQAQYADLAEIYQADADYEPGTVVTFGGSAEITVSSVAHDPNAAGVISTSPAYLMNSAVPGLPLALSGRVPCKVQGPVNKGDRLVSAGNGTAMVLDTTKYQPGCVIGHSLADHLESSVKVIEVVVMKF